MNSLWYYGKYTPKRLLELVENIDEIRQNLEAFTGEAVYNLERAIKIITGPTAYWVYDSGSNSFGPSRFAGYKEMSFHLYEYGLHRACSEPFSGTTANRRIKSITGKDFERNDELAKRLVLWSESIAPALKDKLTTNNWRFLSLPGK